MRQTTLRKQHRQEMLTGYAFIAPQMVGFVVFVLMPLAMVDRLSLVPSLDGCLDAMGFSLGKEVHGFVLEDDWMGTGIRWSHWTNERKRLGQLAVTHLTAMIENGETVALPYLVPLSFVSGASC